MDPNIVNIAKSYENGLRSFVRNIDGINITVKTRSPEKTGDPKCCKCATHLVLLHGWMGSLHDMEEIGDSLLLTEGVSQNCCTAILLDLPYHGESVNVLPTNMPAVATAICRTLSVLLFRFPPSICSGTPLSLLGYSLGGRIAFEMYMTSHYSTHVTSPAITINSLILLSSAPPPPKAQHEAIRNRTTKTATALSSLTTAAQYVTWLRDSWYTAPMWGGLRNDPRFEHMLEVRRRRFSLTRRSAWSKAVTNLDQTSMTIPQRKQVRPSVPILFVHGEDDDKYASFGAVFQSMLPSAQTVAIPGAGHNVLAQALEAVTIKVGSFLHSLVFGSQMDSSKVTIEHVHLMKYSLPLVHPMKVGQSVLKSREGLLVSVGTNIAVTGIGDVCPLEGLHTQIFSSVEAELRQFSKRLQTSGHKSFCVRCVSPSDIDRFTESLSPIIRCGLECALINVFSCATGVRIDRFIHRLLQPLIHCKCETSFHGDSGTIHVNGVLPRHGKPEEQQGRESGNRYLSYVLNSPFHTVKLKVGSASSIDSDAWAVSEAVRACTETGKSLRLDANRAWELSEYLRFEHQLGDHASSLEFIEEPVKDGSQLHDLFRRRNEDKACGKLRIALDESLDDQSLDSIRSLAMHSTAMVVKPAVVGSLTNVSQLANIAVQSGCTLIISSVFDSGVGLAWGALIASVCDNLVNSYRGSRMPCHGLGTFSYLVQDVCQPGFVQYCLRSDDVTVDIAQCHEFLRRLSEKTQQSFGSKSSMDGANSTMTLELR